MHRAPKKEITPHRSNFDAQSIVQELERLFLKYHHANGRAKVLIQTEAKNEILRLLFKEPDRFRDVLLYYNTRKHPYLSINLDIDLWTIADENEQKALRALFARNGIETDEKITSYLVENPAKGEATEWQLLPEGGFRVAVPGSKIRYEFPKLSSNAPRAPRYSYQWQMIQPDSADGKQRDSAVVAGSTGKKQEFQFKNTGVHRIICRLTVYPSGGGALVSYHEFPQVVVPERQRLNEAFSKESAYGVDPALELEFLQLYYDALKKSEQQPGSHKLSEKVEEGYKQQIEKTRERLTSTAHAIPVHGKIRTPIKAVYLNRESGYVMPLKLSVAKIESSPGHEKWRILDTTNPAVRWMTGEYDGEGKNAKEALLNALSTMANGGNRYPAGRIQVEIGSAIAGEKIGY